MTHSLRSRYFKTTAAAAIIVAGCGFATVSFAQDAGAPAAPTDTSSAETANNIVVTARRHAEKLQDVPLAISVVNAQALLSSGTQDLRSVLSMTPGVTLDGNSADAYQLPTIRGQYDLNGLEPGQPNVPVFLDGIYLANPNAISVGLLDIERVEIIKGPVSALYGRNGFSGAINYVSKDPTDTWHSTGVIRGGEYDTETVTADVNGPIIPGVLRIGLAGNYQHEGGTYTDPVNGLKAGGFRKKDFKATFDLAVSSRFKITGGFYYGNDHFNQTPNVYATNNCAYGSYYCGAFYGNPLEVPPIPAGAGNTGNTREVYSANLHATYDLGFATLSYLAGYNKVNQTSYQDYLGARDGITYNLNPGPGTVNMYELFGGYNNSHDYSQELRVISNQNQPFRYAFGGDYFNSKIGNATQIGLCCSGFIPSGQILSDVYYGFSNNFVTATGSPSTTAFGLSVTSEQTSSVFGSFDYDVMKNLTLTGELRYTDDHQQLDYQYSAFAPGFFDPYGPTKYAKFHYINYRASAKYKFSNQVTAYASIANGTKAGGFNGTASGVADLTYQPEKNTTYEVGLKGETADGVAGFEVAIYHIDTSGLQVDGPSSDPNSILYFVKNVGATHNTGVDISTNFRPTKGLNFNIGFAYTDPKFNSGTYDYSSGDVFYCSTVQYCSNRVVTLQIPAGSIQAINLSGMQLERSSEYQLNAALDYKHALTTDVSGFFHIDYRFESRQYMVLDNLYWIPDRTVVNLRTGVGRGPFELALVIRNLTNNKVPISPNPNVQLNNFGTRIVGNLPDPRIISGELSFRF